jgi:hypothetical protein
VTAAVQQPCIQVGEAGNLWDRDQEVPAGKSAIARYHANVITTAQVLSL